MNPWSPLDRLEEAGYTRAAGEGGWILYARTPGPPDLLVAPYDWPMHRIHPRRGGARATPYPGLALEGEMTIREPRRLRPVGRARLEPLPGGALRVLLLEGTLHPWGLLDPYPEPRRDGETHVGPPASHAIEAAIEAGASRILLVAAYTRPHSLLHLSTLPPQPLVILDACIDERPLAAGAWRLAPPWARLVCINSRSLPGLPGSEAPWEGLEAAARTARRILEAS